MLIDFASIYSRLLASSQLLFSSIFIWISTVRLHVLTSSKSRQIGRVIIRTIPIDMMHYLMWEQLALISLLPNKTMFQNMPVLISQMILRRINLDIPLRGNYPISSTFDSPGNGETRVMPANIKYTARRPTISGTPRGRKLGDCLAATATTISVRRYTPARIPMAFMRQAGALKMSRLKSRWMILMQRMTNNLFPATTGTNCIHKFPLAMIIAESEVYRG